MRIALDAMGGDHAPAEVVNGALAFVQNSDAEVVLVGDETQIGALGVDHPQLSVVHSAEVVGMDDSPTEALKKDRDFSIVRAVRLVREKECQGIVTAGNTGAAMASALTFLDGSRG